MLYQIGQLNTAALSAPGEYVQVVPPTTRYINGVATNILGVCGVASWGPLNSPILIGSSQDMALKLGQPMVRKYDLSTAIAVALQLGQNNIRSVRVSDNTDVAASVTLMDTAGSPAIGLTLTGFYTGTVGNTITAAVTAGTAANSFKLSINRPGYAGETFDNITGTGAALWTAMANAVNNGQSGLRGPSQLVVATTGPSTAAPNITATYTLVGGTDGATSVVDTTLIGTDGNTRKGMYAFRGSGVQVMNLIDHTDSTAWGTMASFGSQEGVFMGSQGPAGASYSTVSTSLNTAGADTPWLKPLVGDWVYWQDQVNGVQRLLGPATFWAPLRAQLSPQLSTLNKPILNLIGTQRSVQQVPYSNPELGAAATARLDFLANPSAGGNYFSFQTDRNASSDPTRNGENYTTMTNFLALTLAMNFGYVIGKTQTPDLRREVQNAIQAFLMGLWKPGAGLLPFIGDVNNPKTIPFTVQINAGNNPTSQVALGYMNCYVKVIYLSIVRYFLVSLEGGQSVSVQTSASPMF